MAGSPCQTTTLATSVAICSAGPCLLIVIHHQIADDDNDVEPHQRHRPGPERQSTTSLVQDLPWATAVSDVHVGDLCVRSAGPCLSGFW